MNSFSDHHKADNQYPKIGILTLIVISDCHLILQPNTVLQKVLVKSRN